MLLNLLVEVYLPIFKTKYRLDQQCRRTLGTRDVTAIIRLYRVNVKINRIYTY